MADAQAFVDEMAPYAVAAQNATGINANVILAQWGNETGWGTSSAFTKNFNPAGIGITSSSVSGQDYGSIEGGVQAYINFVNDNSRYQAVKAAGVNNPQAQAVAFGNSGWAAGKYDDGGGPGSSLVADMQSFTAPTGVAPATGLSVGGTVASTPGSTVGNSAVAPAATPGDQSSNGDAYSQIDSQLTSYGLGSLATWAWGELTAGKNSDQIMIDLQTQPAYESSVFGQANAARTKNGLAPMTPADILAYQDQAYQFATAAGMTPGTINQDAIVSLLGNDVSATELNDRLTNGFAAAMSAPTETKTLLNQYFGVNTGDLAAYYLNPENTLGTLKSQLVAAEIGTQAQQSGFGTLSVTTAGQLSSELQAQGKVQPGGAGSGTWNVDVSSQFATLAPLAALENPMPGMGKGAAPVTQNQLLSYGFLNKGQEQVQNALETRKAFASGGGGEDISSTGVVGTGGASDQGIKQTQ